MLFYISYEFYEHSVILRNKLQFPKRIARDAQNIPTILQEYFE